MARDGHGIMQTRANNAFRFLQRRIQQISSGPAHEEHLPKLFSNFFDDEFSNYLVAQPHTAKIRQEGKATLQAPQRPCRPLPKSFKARSIWR